jgi:GT2 family glycosyltransferase
MSVKKSLFEWQDCDAATVNLTERGLTPVFSLFPRVSHADDQPESVIPLLSGKNLIWRLDWQGYDQLLSTVFIKLATGNRLNRCHLVLSFWQEQFEQLMPISQARLDGIAVQDNQLNEFSLNNPLPPGRYWCQLISPDADNTYNTLFLWLTVAQPAKVLIADDVFPLLEHGLMPVMSFSAKTNSFREIEMTMPLLKNDPGLQWPLELPDKTTISYLFLKLATGGRKNQCQLILSIWQAHGKRLVSSATLSGTQVRDNQWTRFSLNPPLKQGKYQCRLYSPDSRDNHVLFIWLTVAYPELARLEQAFVKLSVQDLSVQGCTPLLKITALPTVPQPVTQSIALLRDQVMQWPLDLTEENLKLLKKISPPSPNNKVHWLKSQKKINLFSRQLIPAKNKTNQISSIWLKIGTGGRINQCHVSLLILKENYHYQTQVVAKATLAGADIVDNEWSEFVLDQPLSPGYYWGQLFSPDSDDTQHVLFVNLTTAPPQGLIHYRYRPTSAFTTTLYFAQLKQLPRFNIIILLFAGKPAPYLYACLNSVLGQIYPHWDIWIITQSIDNYDAFLHTLQQAYPHRIQHFKGALKQTAATLYNQVLTQVKGEYTLFLSPNDLLTPDALLIMAYELNQAVTPIDMLYSDEDEINQAGLLQAPYFKPDWSPELLYQQHYTGQLAVYRHQLLRQIGGFREHLYSQAIWDMVLRLTEQAQQIQHVAKILYHRRQPAVGTRDNSGYSYTSDVEFIEPTALLKITQEALNRQGYGGQIALNPMVANAGLLHYPVKGCPLVSIIIPTKDMASLLMRCLDSLRLKTNYPHWEIVIVDNGSTRLETFELFDKYQRILGHAFTVTRQNIPFNFAKLVNRGVKVARGDIIFLLNNDTELVNPHDWLTKMVGFAQLPPIGGVGCRLHYPQDNTIQHAGLICGIGGIANYSHKHFSGNSTGYYHRLAMVANYSAITGAALMVRRELWEKINGFDEALAVAFNDVDFCLKLLEQGFRHLVLPEVIFYHYESKSRGLENTAQKRKRIVAEENYMRQRWGSLLQNDRYYNPHLTHTDEDFSLAVNSVYYKVVR